MKAGLTLLVILILTVGRTGAEEPNKPRRPGLPKTDGQPNVDQLIAFMLKRLDTNTDGKISKDEAKGKLAESFDRLDLNKDGFLDQDELKKVAVKLAERRKNGDGPGKPGERPKFRPGNRPGANVGGLDFDQLDANADGRLTRDEVKGTPLANTFDKIDTNKDGKIDPKELAAYLKLKK